jgi:hypothetical protein
MNSFLSFLSLGQNKPPMNQKDPCQQHAIRHGNRARAGLRNTKNTHKNQPFPDNNRTTTPQQTNTRTFTGERAKTSKTVAKTAPKPPEQNAPLNPPKPPLPP